MCIAIYSEFSHQKKHGGSFQFGFSVTLYQFGYLHGPRSISATSCLSDIFKDLPPPAPSGESWGEVNRWESEECPKWMAPW